MLIKFTQKIGKILQKNKEFFYWRESVYKDELNFLDK